MAFKGGNSPPHGKSAYFAGHATVHTAGVFHAVIALFGRYSSLGLPPAFPNLPSSIPKDSQAQSHFYEGTIIGSKLQPLYVRGGRLIDIFLASPDPGPFITAHV
ncbi:hypothetical protein BJ085DRAFT_33312 [Dimargaris cristalligena]|uniref:Uncharacterized protein n=1 Tax=Dimargaris cristalligena TaxID=215637 RepID=A0A4P9ZPC0_9FUNG|nr:hypothetical protein BJ085DRAFT_33312 [Dimargaris cristalligena]|eukprot:RKP34501.1 hypothetical protein BJ085DRAFT_33312 [Dimargaris cristalligena]